MCKLGSSGGEDLKRDNEYDSLHCFSGSHFLNVCAIGFLDAMPYSLAWLTHSFLIQIWFLQSTVYELPM